MCKLIKNNQTLCLFWLIIATTFMIGCSSAPTVQNSPTTSSNTNSNPAKSAETNKSAVAPEGKPNPPDTTPQIETVYVDLTGSKCKTTDKNEDEGWSVQRCEGVGGYKLEVTDGDDRQTVSVIAPGGKISDLNFQANVSVGFSSIGEKAEWRVKKNDGKITPIAMIIRLNATKGDGAKTDSYLVVSKITADESCITDIVKPIANANEEARKLADTSAKKPCISN